MIEHHIDIQTRHGAMNTFVTYPEEGGPFPVVLFYMDAPGKREELHDMARRLGTSGYYVVLPNLYYRSTREFDYTAGDPTETSAQMFAYMGTLDDDLIESDTEAMFALVDADRQADATRVGAVGYCMSGPFSFAVACRFPERIHAAASVYGVRLFGEGSSAAIAQQAQGELYFACAETDRYAPKEMIDELEAHLRSIGANARVEWYPGTHHGFAFPQRPVYDKLAAERHWERLLSLFDRNLRCRATSGA
ncbi:MAG: hydrolase [Ilumatobacteraceae bacterium]|nr:hydrolase [Ilumatobacteraceae bacterium]